MQALARAVLCQPTYGRNVLARHCYMSAGIIHVCLHGCTCTCTCISQWTGPNICIQCTCMQLMYNTKYMYVNKGMATHIYMDTHMYNVHVFCMLSCMQDGTVGQQLHMSRPKSIGMCISGTSADSRIANCSQDIILTILLTQPQSCQQI